MMLCLIFNNEVSEPFMIHSLSSGQRITIIFLQKKVSQFYCCFSNSEVLQKRFQNQPDSVNIFKRARWILYIPSRRISKQTVLSQIDMASFLVENYCLGTNISMYYVLRMYVVQGTQQAVYHFGSHFFSLRALRKELRQGVVSSIQNQIHVVFIFIDSLQSNR